MKKIRTHLAPVIRLQYGYKINEAMLLRSKRLGIELGE
jgi:hypothetical protein